MTSKNIKHDNTISADDLIAEWFKNPEFVREYEAFEKEFAEVRRQADARDTRRATQLARVGEFWAMCWRHGTGLCRWLVRGHDPVTT